MDGNVFLKDTSGNPVGVANNPLVVYATSGILIGTAAYALISAYATNSGYATTSGYATNANYSTSAGTATNATYSIGSGTATNATYALTCGTASTATHNNLTSIQGGKAAEYYHSMATEYTGTGTGIFVRQYNSSNLGITQIATLGIGVASPTAYFQIKAGTASASTAPIKLTTGIVNTTPETGAIEFDGSNYYFSI